MQTAFEPSKEHHRIVINSLPREGDWICSYCHNLNFAFRKKCNRCKSQTRQENSVIPVPMAFQLQEHYYRALSKNRNSGVVPLADITNTLAARSYEYDQVWEYTEMNYENPEQNDLNVCQQEIKYVNFVPAELLTFSSIENIELFQKIIYNPFFWELEQYTGLICPTNISHHHPEFAHLDLEKEELSGEEIMDSQIEEMVTKLVL